MAIYLAECRRMGIKVLPPDVNESARQFTPGATRSASASARSATSARTWSTSIVRSRKAKGDVPSFADFLRKVELVVCNKRTIESLIKAGAFDRSATPARACSTSTSQAIDSCASSVEARGGSSASSTCSGAGTRGDAGEPARHRASTIRREEWPTRAMLAFEREMLGLYVSTTRWPVRNACCASTASTRSRPLDDGEYRDGARS